MNLRLGFFLTDFQHAWLHLRRNWKFTLFAVAVLGFGIGAVALAYTTVRGIVLRPLPLPAPEQLVGLQAENTAKGLVQPAVSVADFRDFAQRQSVFSKLGAYRPEFATWKPDGRPPVQLVAALVTEDLFAALQVPALLGRTFGPEDFSGGGNAVVLSHQVWRARFGGDPEIVGRSIVLNERLLAVVGVMPPTVREPAFVDCWLPFPPESPEYFARDSRYWSVIGRLAPGISAAQASAGLAAIAEDLARTYPATNHGWGVRVKSLHEMRVGHLRRSLQFLLGATLCLLVVACCNLASLLLARGLSRLDEIAVRLVLGADRRRICRQVLTEHALIGLAGGAVGLGLAAIAVRVLVHRLPEELVPRVQEVSLDAAVWWATAGVALLAGLAAGALPAWQAGRASLTPALGEGGARAGIGAGTRRWQRLLIAAQVGVTCVVLVAAATLGRGLWKLQQTDAGFRADNVFLLQVAPAISRFESNADFARYFERVVETVAAVPGVESAAISCSAPLTGVTLRFPYQVVGDGAAEAGANEAVFNATLPALREVLKLRVISGRWIIEHDREGGAPVVVINETLARRLAANGPVLGRKLSLVPWLSPQPHEVVGVIGDVRQDNLSDAPPAQYYVPQSQAPWFFTTLLVRVAPDRPWPVAALRQTLQTLDPNLAVDFRPHRDFVEATLLQPRLLGGLFATLALAALLVTVFGVYATLRFTVVQRTREFGVRLALGATPAAITGLVVRETVLLVAGGLVAGVPAAFGLLHLLRSRIAGLEDGNAAVSVAIAVALTGAAILAALGPAISAARLAPATALRRS